MVEKVLKFVGFTIGWEKINKTKPSSSISS